MTYLTSSNITLLRPTLDEKIKGRDEYENAYYKFEGSKLARDMNSHMLLIDARDHLLNALKSREGLEYLTRAMRSVELNENRSLNRIVQQATLVNDLYGGTKLAIFQELVRDYMLSSVEHTRLILEKTKP